MSEKKDGGPAFPFVEGLAGYEHNKHGMTLRDYFAGQALAGIMANIHNLDKSDYLRMKGKEIVSAMSYQIADAMLAEREK